MELFAGWSKKRLTPLPKGLVMMGYANLQNIALDEATDLFVRSLVLDCVDHKILYLYYDVNHITDFLFEELVNRLKELGFERNNIFVIASHTHSSPGGFESHLYYDVPTRGFQKEIFDKLIQQGIEATEEALKDLAPAQASYSEEKFPLDWDVAFNRNLFSFHKNREIKKSQLNFNKKNAIDRTMSQWNIRKNKKSAVINWFGVHTTSLSNSETSYHFDNKGYACAFMEEYLGEGSMAIFAQSCAGDVTPHFIYDKKLKRSRGNHVSGDENARENGKLQFMMSKQLWSKESSMFTHSFRSLNKKVHFPSLSHGDKALSSATFGVAFLKGTTEGRGIPFVLALILSFFSKIFKRFKFSREFRKSQSSKDIFITPGESKIFGFKISKKIPFLGKVDPFIKNLNESIDDDFYKERNSWYCENLSIGLTRWNSILVVHLPFEITTVSGQRIKQALKKQSPSIDKVIVEGYSNAYAGYITTPEEYETQRYEGGHTVFGKWTLPILIEELKKINLEMNQVNLTEAKNFSHQQSWTQ